VKNVGAILAYLAAASAGANETAQLSEAQALIRAQTEAKQNGYDLEKYRFSHGNGVLMPGGKIWLFNFVCTPVPPPDCGFFAEVQRETGKVTLIPME